MAAFVAPATLPSVKRRPTASNAPFMRIRPSRRDVLRSVPAAVIPLLLADSGDIQAELSALASHIPGAGMPDVYYPPFFQGDWLVTRELYAVEMSDGAVEIAAHSMLSGRAIDALRNRIGLRETFPVRFVSHRDHIIADRLFNTRAELGADQVLWDADNPNIISVTWGRAPAKKRIRECKLTKRSFVDAPQGYGTFVSSEYARVVDVPSEDALMSVSKAPSVYGRRRLVRYKVSSVSDSMQPDALDRIVVDYIYPPSPPGAKYSMLLKYRDFLNRPTDSRSRFSP
ncbi:hypothetical protein BWQ96_07065 [Gracilariopsis chorda]|uniref:DUF6816 domain-containing protein n=1 Tax=Gracilariopsis chorda TaxID=448386 RepID=A0A2V3IPY3_9FLOR|nr:hypothetical protein BWQ96_07065 [Gracilariopsis chorda]|eukprot:PXF43190.1 hypothetical protein BWQ96_07065 [Gracilariopsis chorda]